MTQPELIHLLNQGLERTLRDMNSWWQGDPIPPTPPIRRWAYQPVLNGLRSQLSPAVVLRGPRQVTGITKPTPKQPAWLPRRLLPWPERKSPTANTGHAGKFLYFQGSFGILPVLRRAAPDNHEAVSMEN